MVPQIIIFRRYDGSLTEAINHEMASREIY